MNKIIKTVNTLGAFILLALLAAKTAAIEHYKQVENDRGDVPGWAIASGAACVLAALVYAAYSSVINKWIAKIK